MPWREITMDRASDRSCAGEGMDRQATIRPRATFCVFTGHVMELAIIADVESLAPPASTVITCEYRSRYESTRFDPQKLGRRWGHSARCVSSSSARRHD